MYCDRRKLKSEKILIEKLPENITDSIDKFWSNQPLRNQILQSQLENLILRNEFKILDHTLLHDSSKGPMANRYQPMQRITNLITLERNL